MSENIKKNKIKNIIIDVIMYVFLALCAFFVAILVFGQKDVDGTTEVFGHQFRVVTSDSMDECEATDVSIYDIKSIPIKSMVFVELVPENEEDAIKWYSNIQDGDVLTFRYVYTTQVTITHRVKTKIDNLDGTFTFELVGDNKDSDENLLEQVITTGNPASTNYIIGKVVGQSKLLGNVVTTLRNPLGMVLIIILPSLAIIIYEILRIVNVISTEKKKQIKEEYDKKENEIELLKQRLAELEKKQNNNIGESSNDRKEDINDDIIENDKEENNQTNDDNTSNDSSDNSIDNDIKENNVDNVNETLSDSKNSINNKTNNSVSKKDLQQWKEDIERREKLLSNEGYVNKAPKNLVDSEREKLEIEKIKLEELLKKYR